MKLGAKRGRAHRRPRFWRASREGPPARPSAPEAFAALADLAADGEYVTRHIGPSAADRARMLATLGLASLEELIDAAVPESIRLRRPLALGPPISEARTLQRLLDLAAANEPYTSVIGMGYYGSHTPQVIVRNVIEAPRWYTAYTPYQPEISQGRLEALLNFQTMVCDLTAMDVANASLLDEATAAAEAMAMCRRLNPDGGTRFVMDADCHPQTIAVVETRAVALGLEVVVAMVDDADAVGPGTFGVLYQQPGSSGVLRDLAPAIDHAHRHGALVAVSADLLALCLVRPPGEMGADIVVGSSQRFGAPFGYGGPHAGYLATLRRFTRAVPGRLVGVSVDAQGRRAYRLALQTREQHIRRHQATSNICTASVLLAVTSGFYAAYHGPDGLRRIATRVHRFTAVLAAGLRRAGLDVVGDAFFDTLTVRVPGRAQEIATRARERHRILVRLVDDDTLGISLDETTTAAIVEQLWDAFGLGTAVSVEDLDPGVADALPPELRRTSAYLQHPVFTSHRSETELLRYIRRLADRDVALDRCMIPLGSCTMKLTATTAMVPVTWSRFADIHPFAPLEHAAGYHQLIRELEVMLAEITGYDAVSLQPNSGAQGEYAGLLAIRAYQAAVGDVARRVCLVPASSHGTNAASAAMAGMQIVVVGCDEHGDVDLDDLREKVARHADELSCLMVTYPSTHGVFEAAIREICALVHDVGGQVYLDGANLNALVGVARLGHLGGDVSHVNVHKTFGHPHGGGGPGLGPIAVRQHLAPYLPNHPVVPEAGPAGGPGPVSAAPWGSAGLFPISWAYLTMMGSEGLLLATQVAILTANYMAARLSPSFPVLYTGQNGMVAHECLIDLRPVYRDCGVTVDDVAKRLIDYGFHAPTVSFPVPGTLMIEATESESLAEVDRFCDAMVAIKAEIDRVSAGDWPVDDNPLRNAPHTAEDVAVENWTHPYSRDRAAYPVAALRADKYWPPVGRIDGTYGDRNVFCSCPPPEAFAGPDEREPGPPGRGELDEG